MKGTSFLRYFTLKAFQARTDDLFNLEFQERLEQQQSREQKSELNINKPAEKAFLSRLVFSEQVLNVSLRGLKRS